MTLQAAIESAKQLGEEIRWYLSQTTPVATKSHIQADAREKTNSGFDAGEWDEAIKKTEEQNGWFTRENILLSLAGLGTWLTGDALRNWLEQYALPAQNNNPISVGIIMAGNIPLVGFHDLLCVIITGNKPIVKYSHSDSTLMPFLLNKLNENNKDWNDLLSQAATANTSNNPNGFSLSALDAVIATGNNNSGRSFENYFKNLPHIIRKNRNSVAILDGTETAEDLQNLGTDIFSYFGLGCRSVSKLYVPIGYNFADFFKNIESYGKVIHHHKYANNYLYNRTIYLMDGKKFTDNNFLLLVENPSCAAPCATVHFEYYKNKEKLELQVRQENDNLQCISTSEKMCNWLLERHISMSRAGLLTVFGKIQSPALADYADGADVIQFLLHVLKENKKRTKSV